MANTIALSSNFIELSNEEMLVIDGGDMYDVGNAVMAVGAIITFFAPEVGVPVVAVGGAIYVGALLGDAVYNATH